MSTELELARLRAIGNTVLVVHPQRQQSGNTESASVVIGVPIQLQNPTNQRAYYVDPMTRRQAHLPAAATTTQGNIARVPAAAVTTQGNIAHVPAAATTTQRNIAHAPAPAAATTTQGSISLACRNFTLASIFICLMSAAVMFLCYLLIPDLPLVSVTYVTLDTHNVSTTQIFANWGIEFSITNYNSDYMSFNRVDAFLLSHNNVSSFVSNTTIKPFGIEDTKRVWARFESVWIPVDGLIYDDAFNGSDMISVTNLNVDLHADTKLEPSWKASLIIQCRNVTVGFSTKETILVGDTDSYECNVVRVSSNIIIMVVLFLIYMMTGVAVTMLFVVLLFLCLYKYTSDCG